MSTPTTSSETGPKFRMAICGAGIGGLVLAITIGKYAPSIPIDLYEAHDSIDIAGVGITIWQHMLQVLVDLGLLDDFTHIFESKPPESGGGTYLRRGDIREGGYLWLHSVRASPISMHRQDMIATLEKHLPASCTVHAKKRLVKYVEPKQEDAHSTLPIRLEFADGTTATADVLVGADGIRSAVRKSMFQAASEEDGDNKADFTQYIDATFTGMTTYRFVVPAEELRKEDPENMLLKQFTSYVGKGRYIVVYPIAKGTLINVVAFVNDPDLTGKHYEGRWTSEVTRDEVLEYFDHFEPSVRTVMKLCEKPSKCAVHVVKPLPFCVRKRVALIGDACHAMTPHFAAGGGQAINDAYMLGRLIAHPLTTLSRVEGALRIYEEMRLPFVQTLASLSLSTGWLLSFQLPEYYDGTRTAEDLDDRGVGAYEREGMEAMKREMFRRWGFLGQSLGVHQGWPDAESKLNALAG